MRRTRIEICRIASVREAELAIDAGGRRARSNRQHAVGGPARSASRWRERSRAVPLPVATFLLTSRERADDIADHVRACETSTAQIVRHVDPAIYPAWSSDCRPPSAACR